MTLPSADQNMAQVEKIEMPNPKNEVYKCLNCGQYMHRTNWSHPVNYCSNCGAELDW
jgi:DNA-directed RNA polymerase subunit RPC12/RpoP